MESGEGLVLQVLEAAVSQDPSQLQVATQKLQEWENEPQFYSILAVSLQIKLIFCSFSLKI